ncbi:GNAT family N-acetyltransferase [Gleimia sp. 6138-11-ORH1]|uniref:GNAT family N-acetyltransferase n=1 Tax=Gleimia sp. 6138-11-ORH1 TaxID=2973937 RepID=UPI00216A476C|nr:GNAT family N-acetyltransferase [Gleimia sp. 6138-11-ORH1]MCS4484439.1 GNAT family N-acetyltransferase [Gleimia sp. 6138-11-ORH1]
MKLEDRLSPLAAVPLPKTHLGLVWKHLDIADLAEVTQLIRRCEAHDQALHSVGDQRLATFGEFSLGKIPAEAIVGRDNTGQVQAFAAVEIQIPDIDLARAEVVAFIAPQYRGRGIGRAVLKWQESKSRQLFVASLGADSHLDVRLANLVDAHLTDRRRLYTAAGFRPIRTFDVMYFEFSSKEVELAYPQDGYQIKPWSQVAEIQLQNLHDEAFKEHWGTTEEIRSWWSLSRPALDPRWSLVALSPSGELAGYIMVCRNPERWMQVKRTEAYVELLGVSPQARAHGIGKALLTHAMRAVQASGISAIGLDVDKDNSNGARSFYERLGFRSVGEQIYFALDL